MPPARPRQFRHPRRRLRIGAGLALLAIVGWRIWSAAPNPALPPLADNGGTASVKRAVDGDTLLLADGQRVRLIGVDTPETKRQDTPVEPFGPEAHEFTRAHVEGKSVRLEFDKERHDKYGRVLAYVYLDNWFLNEELIRAGLGKAITHYPYSEAKKRLFRAAEKEARQKRVGIWSGEGK